MYIQIPDDISSIMDKIRAAGSTAYLYGDAVRDCILGKTPTEYKIATNARPDEIKALFTRTIDTSAQSGAVTVIIGKSGYEVITFKKDTQNGMVFSDDPRDECLRADFTINAMLFDRFEGLTDYFGGQRDIQLHLIRCIGHPERRFGEDPIMMLRAVRLKAALNFRIDRFTEKIIKKCAVMIKKVNPVRIADELNKILLSDNPGCIRDLHRLGLLTHIMPQLEACFGEPQKNKYHIYDVGEHIMHTIENTPNDHTLRWAALLHDIGKPCCPSTDPNGTIHFYGHHRESRRIAMDILHRFKMDPQSIHDIALLVENHDYRVDPNYTSVKRMMSKTGEELFEKLLLLQKADNMSKNPKHYPEKRNRINSALALYKEIIATKQPYKISDLAVNSSDLLKLGYRQGREISDTLRSLLDEVIIKPELNTRVYLMNRATEMRKRKRL